MRIAVYAPMLASEPGHERNVSGHIQLPAHSARLLHDAGHEVHLVTNHVRGERTLPDCVPTDLPMHFVADARKRPDRMRGGPHTTGVRPTKLVAQLAQTRRLVNDLGVDVLHVFGYERTAMIGGLLRTVRVRAPVVATLLGGNLPERLRRFERFLLGRLDAIVTATEYAAGRCTALGLDARVVPHGVVRDLAAERSQHNPADRHRVLFWREPTERNGADLCLAAFDRIAAEHPDVSFDLALRPARPGAEVPGVEAVAARHPNVHVHHFPYRDGPSLADLVAESMLVVLPFRWLSVDPQLTILESVAAGVPVITSNLRSNPELVEDGATGVIVPVGELEPLVTALRDLLGDPDRREGMGRQALTRLNTRWSWDRYVEHLVSIYEDVST
jgi:glycosyltransferase involved in cell wall biosynthesis